MCTYNSIKNQPLSLKYLKQEDTTQNVFEGSVVHSANASPR